MAEHIDLQKIRNTQSSGKPIFKVSALQLDLFDRTTRFNQCNLFQAFSPFIFCPWPPLAILPGYYVGY